MPKFLVVVKQNAAEEYLASDSDKGMSEHFRQTTATALQRLQGKTIEVAGEYFRQELRCYVYHNFRLLPSDVEDVIEV